MDERNAIEVRNVTKKFKMYFDKGKMLKERAISWKRNEYEERWVINGISFDIRKGEAVGLIGHNGCGKSTTLKLLTRIMYPTSGSIEINGRVSSLLELGAGFHPDLSGRENIYINASIFGLTRQEIDKRIEDIIEFSELEEFIDNPVRTYSSGMYMRLAFSVAINVDADILLIDEILAVGDVNFQAKCLNKLMEIKNEGTTIVLVSHSTGQIEQICDRSIWIHDGVIALDSDAHTVDDEYLKYMGEKRKEKTQSSTKVRVFKSSESGVIIGTNSKENIAENNHRGTGEVKIISVKSVNTNKEEASVFSSDDPIIFRVSYEVGQTIEDALIGLCIYRSDGVRCYGTNTKVDGINGFKIEKSGSIEYLLEESQLKEGKYFLDVCIAVGNDDMVDYCSHVCDFEVYDNHKDIGLIRMSHIWTLAE